MRLLRSESSILTCFLSFSFYCVAGSNSKITLLLLCRRIRQLLRVHVDIAMKLCDIVDQFAQLLSQLGRVIGVELLHPLVFAELANSLELIIALESLVMLLEILVLA